MSPPVPDRPAPLTGKFLLAYGHGPMGDLFKALAHPARVRVLELFEICGRLAMKYGLSSSRQAISQHLEVLESAGLLTTRREGRYKFHHVDTSPLRQIVERWPTDRKGSGGRADRSDERLRG